MMVMDIKINFEVSAEPPSMIFHRLTIDGKNLLISPNQYVLCN